MFTDLSDEELATLITKLRTAAVNLATGQQTAEIHLGDSGEKFHPSDPAKTLEFLNTCIRERDRRAGCGGSGAIFPAGV